MFRSLPSNTHRTSTYSSCHGCRTFKSSGVPRRRVACSASAAAGNPEDAKPVERGELLEGLQTAVALEDYAAAMRIKRQLDAVDDADPLVALKKRLQQAVANERYEDAVHLKQELIELEQRLAPPGPAPQTEAEQVPCTSDATTHGIRVQVRSQYVAQQSMPAMSRYFFTYRVVITNDSSSTVQLKSRHWVITDATEHVEHVRGPGVVGEEPVLQPGSAYSYQSGCPLHTSHGSMTGEYTMLVLDGGSDAPPKLLEVTIAKVGLSTLGDGR